MCSSQAKYELSIFFSHHIELLTQQAPQEANLSVPSQGKRHLNDVVHKAPQSLRDLCDTE